MPQRKERGDLLLFIDNQSGVPIYDQICTQIRQHIMNGELKPDEPLPSIRSLAKELRISVITTKRVYEELEKEGFVYTVPSTGCFVAHQNLDRIREENLKQLEQHLTEAAVLAKNCGLTWEETAELLKAVMDGN